MRHAPNDAPIAPEIALSMYHQMLRIRLIEEAIAKRYAEQEMRCPTHLCIGQEASPVGVSALLRREDLVFSGHRSHGHYLAKGGDLKAMLAELYGRATGCAGGKGGSQHLVDQACGFLGSAPILASTISVGVGAAWGAVMSKEDRVVVIYFGDGATEEGSFHEAMNFAGTKRLPVIFVCENNLYSVHSTLDVRQPDRPIAMLGPAHGCASAHGDGNDVEAVRRLAVTAVNRARSGGGPTLIELATYRWLEHCGPNDDLPLKYRSPEEMAEWKARDPVANYRTSLLDRGILDPKQDQQTRGAIEAEIDEGFDFARTSPFPRAQQLMSDVYPPLAAR